MGGGWGGKLEGVGGVWWKDVGEVWEVEGAEGTGGKGKGGVQGVWRKHWGAWGFRGLGEMMWSPGRVWGAHRGCWGALRWGKGLGGSGRPHDTPDTSLQHLTGSQLGCTVKATKLTT